MPRARRPLDDELPAGLRFFLVHGRTAAIDEDPGVPHGFGGGVFQAFELWGRLDRAQPAAWTELHALWTSHSAEIRAHTPDGEEPWIETALREAGVIA